MQFDVHSPTPYLPHQHDLVIERTKALFYVFRLNTTAPPALGEDDLQPRLKFYSKTTFRKKNIYIYTELRSQSLEIPWWRVSYIPFVTLGKFFQEWFCFMIMGLNRRKRKNVSAMVNPSYQLMEDNHYDTYIGPPLPTRPSMINSRSCFFGEDERRPQPPLISRQISRARAREKSSLV